MIIALDFRKSIYRVKWNFSTSTEPRKAIDQLSDFRRDADTRAGN